jgi:hypothetical protein
MATTTRCVTSSENWRIGRPLWKTTHVQRRRNPDWKTGEQAARSGLSAARAGELLARLILDRALSDRVRIADNPEAYWFAVVAEEFRKAVLKLKSEPAQLGCQTPPDAATHTHVEPPGARVARYTPG